MTSRPHSPREVGFYDTSPAYAWTALASASYVYIGAGGAGLQIFDVSDPRYPLKLGDYGGVGAYGIALRWPFIYMGWEQFRVIDVRDPRNPVQVNVTGATGSIWDIVVSGSYAYVAQWYLGGIGVAVVDVSDPRYPRQVGARYKTPGDSLGVAVAGNYAYVADGYAGLRVIDVSNPAALREAAFYDTRGTPGALRFRVNMPT